MGYRPGLDVSGALAAVPLTSLKASAIGAALIATFAMVSAADPLIALPVFAIAFMAGLFCVGVCLAVLGPGLRLAFKHARQPHPTLLLALASAMLVSTLIALILNSLSTLPVVLAYAIPAAILYRREILTFEAEA